MAVDTFIEIDGIQGESTDSKRKNDIEVLSWSFGSTNTGTMAFGTGGGAGKVSMQDFSFTKRVDKSTPKLQLANWKGDHIKFATLRVRKAGGDQQEFLTYKFSDLLVSSVQLSSSDEVPMEQISLNFTKVELEYKPQDEKGQLGGAIKSGYDLKIMKNV